MPSQMWAMAKYHMPNTEQVCVTPDSPNQETASTMYRQCVIGSCMHLHVAQVLSCDSNWGSWNETDLVEVKRRCASTMKLFLYWFIVMLLS